MPLATREEEEECELSRKWSVAREWPRVDEVAKFAAHFGRHLVLPERYTRVAIIRDPGFRRSLGRQAAKQRSPLYRGIWWYSSVAVRLGAWSELSLNLPGKPIKRCGNIRKVNDGYDNAWFCTREQRVLWIWLDAFRLIYIPFRNIFVRYICFFFKFYKRTVYLLYT